MFREMRRFKQELTKYDSIKVLENGSYGTLAVYGDDGYPYAVPINYVYADGNIYFHCANQGHKLDAVQNNSKASFCVVSQDRVIPERLTTIFESVIAFGHAKVIENEVEKRKALEYIAQKYCSDNGAKNKEEIEKHWNAVCIIALKIEHMTGKASMDIIASK